jgi:hypothetical protein
MNLTYSVLWFDNSRDFFDSLDCTSLEEEIKSWGFTPKIMFETDPAAFMLHSPFTKLDLIVVDYDLGENEEHGETFIRNVRDNSVLTEVVFYSNVASKQLWTAISDKELEGVYVANRGNVLARIERVAKQSVHKVLDLNNMRGMVMAEVGDIDHILDELLVVGWPLLSSDHQKDLVTSLKEGALAHNDATRKSLEALSEVSDVNDIGKVCDSNKRWSNFNRLKKRIPTLKQCNPGEYPAEILAPRNFLAHGQAREEDGVHIFSFNGKEYRFDETVGVQLRGRIVAYKEALQGALSALSSGRAEHATSEKP